MKNKLLIFSIFLFILSLFFPIRHVFHTPEAYLTGQYSDFTSFSLYLSDILLFTTCFLLLLPRGGGVWAKLRSIVNCQLSIVFLVFWLILGLILHFSHTTLFWTLKLLELIVAYGTVKLVMSDELRVTSIKDQFLKVFVSFSAIQSIIALLQFYKQTSFGLYRLGESHLSANIDNVAKLIVNGKTYIRAYGTFPHPNVLATFLITSAILSIYLFLNSSKKWQVLWGMGIFLNILGITVTFSRAAYIVLILGLTIFFFSLLIIHQKSIKDHLQNVVMVFLIVIASFTFSFLLFRSFLLTRATISDNAVSERMEYNAIGLGMIKNNPIFGVGAGESVLHMEQYADHPLAPWQKQPIHNFFLLSASEMGIPGMLLLIWILLYHLKKLVSGIKYNVLSKNTAPTTYYLLLATILCSFLTLMLFDHYFYTLQQTQLLLWITLGIIAATKKEAVTP